ncbi:proteoglycan 4-like [Tribolium madens]|uniref:proteoglycan 4-like n=1 Tax=Tribolium madens TaxID=41895 RepID=UPI001CF73C46|nr:proteoglycan 4-like [Tribolium madens]
MANKDDYLTYYREFFESFAQTVNPNDQLPVKLGSYKLINLEVIGGVIDWTTQYLTQKKCPQSLIAPLIQIVIDETRKSCKKQPTACGFNPSDNAYEPLKLMQTVMAKTNEICLRYLDNSMLCSLPPPGQPHNIVSVCAAKNKRRRMEDRHVVVHDLNTMFNLQEASPSSYYAIFDGHAGHDAAAYSSAHLHQFLAESKHFVANPEQALIDAFCKTDTLFIDKCNVERFNSGTTAVCALLRPKEKTLYIAWVGDSQALLVNQGRVLQCVNPHKPCRSDERERIEKEGGFVCYWGTWRVNGQLAVSRAIGDAEYKPYVIAVPDIREIPLDGGEDFLILACDGLWDYLSEDDAARTVYEMVCNNPDKTDLISERLVQLSKDRGSADNISVIVVFLREPSKIAAEAHWANRNASSITMDTSLDNANNPFANSNGADTNIMGQKTDGLLLNLAENFKHNGADVSPSGDFYHNSEKSNGKRSASEFDDDDDLGPETDVDAVDDVLSPSIAAAKALAEGLVNNNPDGSFNPFVEKHEVEKAALEIDLDLQKQQSSEFDGQRSPREETPTPPADAVHDGGLEENVGDSGEESEDEWNYIKGEEANKENISPSQPDCEVAQILEDPDNMSQLNPNAAEFVPVSPTRSIPSPACRALINDPVIAQSPKRPSEIDISLPNPQEFENEVKSRPSDFDSFSNGHDHEDEQKPSSQDLIENILNGKNIDEIPEFQPGNTPTKMASALGDEFHFGPNAAPFTPKMMDQSEAGLSTKAVFGDESNLDTSMDTSQDITDFKKEDDPMSMSFYQDKTSADSDPFDLNKVQLLPENLDEFLNKSEETLSNDPTKDLISNDVVLDNDERIQTTDLDNEKELASPVSNDDDSSGVCELSKSPQPQTDDLIECNFAKDTLPDVCLQPEPKPQEDLLKIESPEPPALSPQPQAMSPSPLSVSPQPPVLSPEPELLPKSSEPEFLSKSPEPEFLPKSPEQEFLPKSPEPEQSVDVMFAPVEVEEKKEVSVESPFEDITSSVKDISSPVTSPVPDQVITEPIELNFAQEVNSAVQEIVPPVEDSSPIREPTLVPDIALSTPKSVTDTESVATADVNSFLERSEIVDLTSPLQSPGDHTLVFQDPTCVYPQPTEIKTETITPEFAQSAVISPTESKESPQETVKEPEVVPEVAAPAPEKKLKAKAPTATKKSTPAKPSTASPAKAKPTTTPKTKPLTSARAAAPKPSTGAVPKQTVAKAAAPKPKPAATKTTEKKPLTNGEAKPPVRSNLTARKSVDSPKPAVKASTTTKPAAPRPPMVSSTRTTTTTRTSATAPKPRPNTLVKTSTTTKTTVSTTASKLNTSKTTSSPTKTASPPKPRPTTAPAKPRVPLSKTVTKTADKDKESKDSANKLTASRTVMRAASARTTTGTVRKTESKTTGTATRTTVTKTTTSSTTRPGAAAGKKPLEITRTVSKTKTTKIEKPVQNGVTTVVTEQITLVNNAVNDSDSQLMKDNSPIDNKLIVDTNAAD